MPTIYDSVRGTTDVSAVNGFFRGGFSGTALNTDRWTATKGAGGTQAVSGGNLTLGLGTGANEENSILSNIAFRIPSRVQVSLSLSQRIANQTIFIELVSVDATTGLPDGLNTAAFVFSGTTATNAICRCQNDGVTALDSSAQTILTTASQSVFELQVNASMLRFVNVAQDSAASPTLNFVRSQSLPDPNAIYKLRIRGLNGATPPASNTNVVVNYAAVTDFNPFMVELVDSRTTAAATPVVGTGTSGRVAVTLDAATLAGATALNVQGTVASDGVLAGNPLVTGFGARTANITAVASGDAVTALANTIGAQVELPYAIPESTWQYGSSTAITNTTDVAVKAAAAAGIRNYVTGLSFVNTSATGTVIVVKDGSTVIWAGYAQQNVSNHINFPVPLRGTAATAVNVAALTTAANVYVSAQGYIAP